MSRSPSHALRVAAALSEAQSRQVWIVIKDNTWTLEYAPQKRSRLLARVIGRYVCKCTELGRIFDEKV